MATGLAIMIGSKKPKSPRESMMDASPDSGNEDTNMQPEGSGEDDEYPGEDDADDQKVEFDPPPTWRPPSGTRPGDTINAMVTLRVKPDGSLCIEKLDNTSMPGYDKSSDEQSSDDTSDQSMGDTSMSSPEDNVSQGRIG